MGISSTLIALRTMLGSQYRIFESSYSTILARTAVLNCDIAIPGCKSLMSGFDLAAKIRRQRGLMRYIPRNRDYRQLPLGGLKFSENFRNQGKNKELTEKERLNSPEPGNSAIHCIHNKKNACAHCRGTSVAPFKDQRKL